MAEARAHGLDYVYRTIDLDGVGIAPSRSVSMLTGRAQPRLRRPQRHPPLQAAGDRAPRRSSTTRAARLGAVNTVVFDGARRGRLQHRHHRFRHRASATGCPARATDRGGPARRRGRGRRRRATRCCASAPTTSWSSTSTSTAPTALAHELSRAGSRGAGRRVDPDKLPVLLPASDGVVHCTPTGMADHPGLPLDADLLHPGLWVADIVYRPLDTELLHAARGRAAGRSTAATWRCTRPPTRSRWSPGSIPTSTACSATFTRLLGGEAH